MSAIIIDSVFRKFGHHEVLRGATLRLESGKITGLLGRNGSGKSTLLKILTGTLRADHAWIGLNGRPLRNLYQTVGLINYLPQHDFHPDHLSLRELLLFYRVDAAPFLTENALLFPDAQQPISELSGGMRRLFAVLLLLAAPTRFTILDEPFTHLMPLHLALVCQRIRECARRKGLLVTDHQYHHVRTLSDKCYLLHSGTTTEVKTPEQLVRLGYLRHT